MKNLVRFSIVLILLISIPSCQSEPVTDIGKIENELKTVVKDHNISKCSIYVNDSGSVQLIYDNTDFTVNNGSVIIHSINLDSSPDEIRFNLLHLSRYIISGATIKFIFN